MKHAAIEREVSPSGGPARCGTGDRATRVITLKQRRSAVEHKGGRRARWRLQIGDGGHVRMEQKPLLSCRS